MNYVLVLTLNLLSVLVLSVLAQNNAIVINNDAYIVLNGGSAGSEAVLVVNQSHPSGIVAQGSGGNIITRGEHDYVKWNIGAGNVGDNFVVPLTTGPLGAGESKIPLSVEIDAAGIGSGYMVISSWEVSNGVGTAAYDNTPWPNGVTHMAGAAGAADVSEYAVDRFWIIDADDPLGTGESYATKPDVTMSISYNNDASEIGNGNLLSVGNLGAQRYDLAANKWYGWFIGASPQSIWGADNGAGLVSGIDIPPFAWNRIWTLADYANPLPVDLLSFEGECMNEGLQFKWSTASEIHSSHFELQGSNDGYSFETIVEVPSSGSSNYSSNYEFVLNAPGNKNWFKLIQHDLDGNSTELDIIKTLVCNENGNVEISAPDMNEILIDFNSDWDGEVDVIVYDALGKMVMNEVGIGISDGNNKIRISRKNLSFGSYLVKIDDRREVYSEMIVLR